jgi:DNA-binding transcriptional LysR family regulator
MLNLNDLFLFVQVVDRKGFSATARALGMPKSSVSNRINRLERELGVRLIQRTSRSFAVTELGREFYDHAAAMLIEAEAAEDTVKRRLAEPSGTVRLTSSPATAHSGLSSVLARFLVELPKVRITHQVTNRNVDLVEEGLDLAVRAHHGSLPDSTLIQRQLGFSERWLVASPRFLETAATPDSPDDLEECDALCMQSMISDGLWALRSDRGIEVTVRPNYRLFADDLQSLKQAAIEKLGIAALPAGLCTPAIAAGTLVRVLPHWIAGGATITILAPSRRGQLPSVRALSDFLAHNLPAAMNLVPGDGIAA